MVAAPRRMSAQFLSIRSTFTLPPTRGRKRGSRCDEVSKTLPSGTVRDHRVERRASSAATSTVGGARVLSVGFRPLPQTTQCWSEVKGRYLRIRFTASASHTDDGRRYAEQRDRWSPKRVARGALPRGRQRLTSRGGGAPDPRPDPQRASEVAVGRAIRGIEQRRHAAVPLDPRPHVRRDPAGHLEDAVVVLARASRRRARGARSGSAARAARPAARGPVGASGARGGKTRRGAPAARASSRSRPWGRLVRCGLRR